MNSVGWMLFAADVPADAQAAPPVSPFTPLLTMVLPLVLLYFFLIMRPQRQRDRAHRELLENLKKNDRVITIGGIYGMVTNVQRESDEVTLKVDEATNSKLRVTFGSIARVITDDNASGEKQTNNE